MVVVCSQADLMQVVTALGATGGFASRLHGWKQKGNQDGDNCDDDQQFDQRETRSGGGRREGTEDFDLKDS